MDKAELKRINRQLDRMDDRVRKLIARRKPLELDRSSGRKTIAKPRVTIDRAHDYAQPIGCGQLAGNEMPIGSPSRRAHAFGCQDNNLAAGEERAADFIDDVIFAEWNAAWDSMGAH